MKALPGLLLPALLLLAAATPASAADSALCAKLELIAAETMRVRQSGTPMPEVLALFARYDFPGAADLVQAAYNQPAWLGTDQQRYAVMEFAVSARLACEWDE